MLSRETLQLGQVCTAPVVVLTHIVDPCSGSSSTKASKPCGSYQAAGGDEQQAAAARQPPAVPAAAAAAAAAPSSDAKAQEAVLSSFMFGG